MPVAAAIDLTPGLACLERVRSIACDVSAVIDVELRTASMKRFMRKDFYWVSLRLFFARGANLYRSAAALALAERETETLAQHAHALAHDAVWPMPPEIYRVRLLSPRCARLARAMRRADHALALLLALELSGRLGRRERLEMGAGAMRALYRIKTSLLSDALALTGRGNP